MTDSTEVFKTDSTETNIHLWKTEQSKSCAELFTKFKFCVIIGKTLDEVIIMRSRFLALTVAFSMLFGMSCVNYDCDLTAIAATENDEETAHTHNWVAVNKTVHHDEVGHWETKNKPYTVTITYSGKVVNSKEHGYPTFYDGLKALGCWDSSYVNYHSDKSMTGTNFTAFDFGTNSNTVSDDTFSAIKDHYDCGSTTSCKKRTIMETTYNSWDELSNDLAFYKNEFGLDLSYAKENCYEKTWVVDKAAYDETVVDHYECSICGEIDSVMGDINGDEEFTIADVVLLQKWLLAVPDIQIENWQLANFCRDDRLDVFDICLMRRELIAKSQTP